MTKELVIVNDAGNEFSVTDMPIPFYIRLKIDNKKTKYRAKIMDEDGNTRSFYTGVTDRDYLELHVPGTPLRNNGKIIIEIEVSDLNSKDTSKYQACIDYVSREEYERLNPTEIPDDTIKEAEEQDIDGSKSTVIEEIVDEPSESHELTLDELAYLTQRSDILNETESKDLVVDQILPKETAEEE